MNSIINESKMSFENFKQLTFTNLDCEVHYWYKKGTSEDYIILLHGAGADHVTFEKQIELFDNAYNIIAWDARGQGLSKMNERKKFNFADMYDDCLKLFEIHNIKTAILIGQSMGGNLAQAIAYHRPELVSKLILIDCTKNTQKLSVFEKIILKMSRFIFYCYPWKTLVRQSANACGITRYTRNYVKQCFEKLDKKRIIEIMMSLLTCLQEDTEHKFKQPVLLLYGDKDRAGNIRKAMKLWAKEDDNCKLCIIENAGHVSNMDNPDEVNKNILDFING